MLPVFPDKVNTVLLVPEHTDAPPETLPAVGTVETVTVADAVVAELHTPEVTTAR